jgi:NADH:ubiquinone oxidoreductase subunit 6 (subunit J)
MAYIALFATIALLEIVSAVLVFVFRNILHTILALALLFVFNSIMFLMLEQPLLALFQLFIMVGGVVTYIFVGVASSSYSKFKGTNYKILAIAYLAIFLLFSFKVVQSGQTANGHNILSTGLIQQSFESNIGIIYLLAIMLFGAGLSSIILIRKLGGSG